MQYCVVIWMTLSKMKQSQEIDEIKFCKSNTKYDHTRSIAKTKTNWCDIGYVYLNTKSIIVILFYGYIKHSYARKVINICVFPIEFLFWCKCVNWDLRLLPQMWDYWNVRLIWCRLSISMDVRKTCYLFLDFKSICTFFSIF